MDFITRDTIRDKQIAEKQARTFAYKAPNAAGEMRLINSGSGKSKPFVSPEMFKRLADAQGEMNGADDLKKVIQHTVVNMSAGQAEYPTIYQHIYDKIVNANFTETVDVADFIGMKAAFGVVQGGESVPLAKYKVEKTNAVKFLTYALGYSISEIWLDYNQFWKIEQANKAVGIAYNAALDHLYLSPIISSSYTGKAITNKESGSGLAAVHKTLYKALKDVTKRRGKDGYILRPTIALCNSSTAIDVENAVKGLLQEGSQLGALGQIKTVLSYDGWQGNVGNIEYNYPAPEDGEVYLIQPKKGFKELVRKELVRMQQKGNVLDLSAYDVAYHFQRAVIADVANSVHKVKIA